MQVALIEPDSILAKSYAAALSREGHRVTTSKTAQAAIQAADRQTPEVVVLNLDMPRNNGMDFLYEFRSYPEWRSIPVVLLVSRLNHDMADARVLRTELGVHAVLVRSQITLSELCAAVGAAAEPSV